MFVLILLLAVAWGQEVLECPPGYESHPLILVSMDGFRYDYLPWANNTPRIDEFRASGVSAPFMKASYPTITFPNHYTIVTGLYPESHGIIANHFYDPVLDSYFDIGSNESLEEKWWGGDPIWNTVTDQGKKSATMFWPGSDALVEGKHPTYWFYYNESYPFEDRVNQVLEWLALPEEVRPVFISVYFEQPDSAGHGFGPFTPEVYDQLGIVDQVFGSLLDGVTAMNLTSCVNIMLVSDHGMSTVGQKGAVQIYDYVPDISSRALVYDGVLVRMDVYDPEDVDPLRQEMTCKVPHAQQYVPSGMPTRMHYSNNVRIGDILLEMTLGHEGFSEPGYYVDAGDHGFDNFYPEMQPIFMARGPEFLSGAQVEPFQNIELYNLMSLLMEVNPAPNNGTLGTLYQLLKTPPDYPSNPEEDPPIVAQYPSDAEVELRLRISNCTGDLNTSELWMTSLNLSVEEENQANDLHLPWGIPQIGELSTEVVLLYHQDHVTGYSTTLKMPLWTSFTLENIPFGTSESNWCSDVRLNRSTTATCNSYESLQNITMEPLFPNRYSKYPTLERVPYLVSNAVPMTVELKAKWNRLLDEFVDPWMQSDQGPLNIIIGPVFDLNADSLADNMTTFTDTPTVPSHLFLMALRCQDPDVSNFKLCLPEDLDALGFIYPVKDSIPNCLTNSQYMKQFSAKVKDIELVTGLLFNTGLSYQDRIHLETRVPTSLWI